MRNLNQHILYGIIPTFAILYFSFIFHYSMDLFMNHFSIYYAIIFYFIFFIITSFLIKKIPLKYIVRLSGFTFITRLERVTLFSIYYVLFIYMVYQVFFSHLEFNSLLYSFLWLLMIMAIEFFHLQFKLNVQFIQISPRLYTELIKKEVHSQENIDGYEVTANYYEDLQIEKIPALHRLLFANKEKRNINKIKIKYIDYQIRADIIHLIAFDKDSNQVWESDYGYDKEITKEKDVVEYLQLLIKMENH